jgi:hypothetical protein
MNNIPSNTKTYLCALLEHKNESNPNDNVYVHLKEYRKRYFAEARSDLSTTGVIKSPLDLKAKKGEKIDLDKVAFGGAGTGITNSPNPLDLGLGDIAAAVSLGQGLMKRFVDPSKAGSAMKKIGSAAKPFAFLGTSLLPTLRDLTGLSYLDLQKQAFGPEYAGNVVSGAGSPPVTLYTPQTQYSQQNWISSLLSGSGVPSTSRRRTP